MFIGYKDGSIIFGGTTNQPHDNLVITLDEMEQLAAFYQHEQDKTAVKEYLKTAINILGSAEISTELAKKYLYDAGLLDQLVEESNHSQENFGDNFLTSIAKGIEALEKRLDVKEWEGLPEPVANRMAHEFIAERNPCRWTGSGDAPDDVGFEPLNLPIDDIYPNAILVCTSFAPVTRKPSLTEAVSRFATAIMSWSSRKGRNTKFLILLTVTVSPMN